MPSWLSDWVGTDMAPLAYYALVAAIVLVLIVVVLAVAKKAMGTGTGPKAKGRGPRLAVMDVSMIDAKRKLVLVRRDEVEHLLLIGGQNDIVVEASILRVGAGGRQGRTEPSLGGEGEFAQRAVPSRTGVAPARGASPLTRPVPRSAALPAAAAADVPPVVSPAPERTEPVLETIRPIPPVDAPATGDTESHREAPNVDPRASSSQPPAIPVVEPPVSADATPRPPASVVSPDSAPPVAVAVPPVVSPAPSSAAEPTIVPPAVPPPAPPQQVQAQAPTAAPPPRSSSIPASALPRPIAREGERAVASKPAADANVEKTAQASIPPRFSVGGTLEPVQRSGQPTPIQPVQSRSMATPTYPARQSPASVELEAKVGSRPEPDRRPSEGGDIEKPSQTSAPEPSPEDVLARLLAKAKEPVIKTPAAGPSVVLPPERPRTEALPSAPPKVEIASTAPAVSAPDAGERRPLSVRSFASAIQGRQSVEAAAPQPTNRREVEAPAPVAPPLASPVPAPVETAKAPTVALPGPAAASRQPATSWEDEEDDLEDFLSAQLNDELGEDIWTAKDAPAAESPAPPVRPERQEATVSPPSDDTIRAPAPAKRPLTLEEEMERLLGDFDLETSDRRHR